MLTDSSAVTATTGATPSGPGPAQHTGRAGLASSDFETFLKMLTTQMQNQDPLNPIEATDFALQLATFSGVEQQVRTNTLLESLVSKSALTDLAGWVGMEARAPTPATWRGDPLDLALSPPDGAERVSLLVRNAMGQQVDSQPVAPDATSFRWNGLGADGLPLPHGDYAFELVGFRDGAPLEPTTPEVHARVTEVRQDASGPMLVLEGGRSVAPEAVTALRH